jgi:hypothetical protein
VGVKREVDNAKLDEDDHDSHDVTNDVSGLKKTGKRAINK